MFKGTQKKVRWLMLGEDNQPVDLILTCVEQVEKGNYDLLTCIDSKGGEYKIAAFERDVEACTDVWGGNATKWKEFHLTKKPGQSRYKVVPCDEQLKEENIQC